MPIDLNQSHPAYDLSLEILATLPTYPCGVSVDDLRQDFGLEVNDLRTALRNLRNKSWLVASRQKKVYIEPAHRKLVDHVAGKYFDQVYPIA